MTGTPIVVEVRLPTDLPQVLDMIEWHFIEEALSQTRGQRTAAAKLLGLNRTTLVEKLRRRAKQEARR